MVLFDSVRKWVKKLYLLSNYILVISLATLQFFIKETPPKGWSGDALKLYNELADNKFEIVMWLVVVVAILRFINYCVAKKEIDNVITSVLDEVLSSVYDKDKEHYRATIFKPQVAITFLIPYLYVTFKFWKKHKNKGVLRGQIVEALKLISFRNILTISHRRGLPYPNGTTTFFEVVERVGDANGVVSRVFTTGTNYEVELPNINNINLDDINSEDELSRNKKTLIKRYMNKGHIKPFSKLKQIHRRSTNIWATAITSLDEKTCGVFVIDHNLGKEGARFDDNELLPYAKILNRVLIHS